MIALSYLLLKRRALNRLGTRSNQILNEKWQADIFLKRNDRLQIVFILKLPGILFKRLSFDFYFTTS
jgi:hypothetical protein